MSEAAEVLGRRLPVSPTGNLSSPDMRAWITNFFHISDNPESNDLWVKQFAQSAQVIIGPNRARGESEIRKLREEMWTNVKTRKHTVRQVFPAQSGVEVMLFGKVDYTTKDDKTKTASFAAHGILDKKKVLNGESEAWNYVYYRVWLQYD